VSDNVKMCVCVCERERERDRESFGYVSAMVLLARKCSGYIVRVVCVWCVCDCVSQRVHS